MQINISTRHGQLSSETREKLSSKLEKLSRFHERVTSVNVTLDLEHPDSPNVELRVSVERTPDFVANDASGNLISCFESAIHKVEQQLRKHQGKLSDRRTSGPTVRKMDSRQLDEEEGESSS